MSFLKIAELGTFEVSRRAFLGRSGVVLSAFAIAMLAGCESVAAGQKGGGSAATDVSILNTALDAELEAIAAYQVGAGSGLITSAIKTGALQFQAHPQA